MLRVLRGERRRLVEVRLQKDRPAAALALTEHLADHDPDLHRQVQMKMGQGEPWCGLPIAVVGGEGRVVRSAVERDWRERLGLGLGRRGGLRGHGAAPDGI